MQKIESQKENIMLSIRDAKIESVVGNTDKVFSKIVITIFDLLKKSYAQADLQAYKNWLFIVRWDYDISFTKPNNPRSYIRQFYRENLTNMLMWEIHILTEIIEAKSESVKTVSSFMKEVIACFTEFAYENIKILDLDTYRITVAHLRQALSRLYHSRDLNKKQEGVDVGFEAKQEIIEEIRELLMVLNFWTIQLYWEEKISAEAFDKLQSANPLTDFSFDRSFDLLLKFRDHNYTFKKIWERWDHEERISGEMYTPPHPAGWATFAFLIHVLKHGIPYFQIKNFAAYPELPSVLDDLIARLVNLKTAGFEKFGELLELPTQQAFNKRIDTTIHQLESFKSINDQQKLLSIVEQPLNGGVVTNLKNEMIKGFEAKNDVLELHEKFGVITDEIADSNKFKTIGSLNNWSNKQYFLEGDLRMSVFGLEDIGIACRNRFQNTFLLDIQDGKTVEFCADPIEGLTRVVERMRKKHVEPTVIVIDRDLFFSDFPSLNHPSFKFNVKNDQLANLSGYFGTFMDIPIINIPSRTFTHTILVADFASSFTLFRKILTANNPDFIHCAIKEISDADATVHLETQNDFWMQPDKGNGNAERAKLHIRSNVLIDFYVKVNFSVKNRNSYELLFVGENIPTD